ncbi:hypothetical protein VIGAN_04409100 [Vigna angularis var. angularis]|uniref:Uncharacterized protein n=1 Tax=Vigna angularis var. angularis TaxID=157739 RepID=A0A0S3S0U7_PHAAN|nr:hypothetical protein VIGAN_04409100 [Vigna angularis var. angularis]
MANALSKQITISAMDGLSFPFRFTQWRAVLATNSNASISFTSGGPTLGSKMLTNSPAKMAGTAKSTKRCTLKVPPSSPSRNIALFPVKSSSSTTPSPYTSLFAVNIFRS